MIRAVAFDLDGTLIDSNEGIVAACFAAFAELEKPAPERTEIIRTISLPLEEQLHAMGVAEIERCAEAYRRHYLRIAPGMTKLFPEVREGLSLVQSVGLPMAVVTSKKRNAAEMLLARLDVWKHFGFCIGPDEVRHPKPHPEPLLAAAERFGVAPGELMYVGDSELDARSARAAGSPFVGVLTGSGTRDELSELGAIGVFARFEDAVRCIVEHAGVFGVPSGESLDTL